MENSIQMYKSQHFKNCIILLVLTVLVFLAIILSFSVGAISIKTGEVFKALLDKSHEHYLIVHEFRLPRTLVAGLVGICLSLSGCILQGVMRNNLASPATIGVTSGASFVGYITIIVFPQLVGYLAVGTIVGAFLTTMGIYILSYSRGVSPVRMILSGLAVSALFGAFNDIIKMAFVERIGSIQGFLVGGLNTISWDDFYMILPFALVGIFLTILVPSSINILLLGDEVAVSLGLRVELFRFFLIVISSILAGSAVAVAGLISFVGLMVPHIARLLVGSDYKYLFPASALLGVVFMIICDAVGRIIIVPAEMPVSIIVAFVGAPFFLYLLRKRKI